MAENLLNWADVDDDGHSPSSGWVDLVLWIVILATPVLLVGFVLPHFIPPKTSNCRSSCIANLKQLEGAKATWALEYKKEMTDLPTDTDLFGAASYIREKPVCPEGGHYVIGAVGAKVTCSIPGHTL